MPSNQDSTVFLDPSQYQSFARSSRGVIGGFSGTPVTGDDGTITGYNVPSGVYDKDYSILNRNGLIQRGSDLPRPGEPGATAAAPDNAGITPLKPMAAPPTYAQFAQQWAQRGPVTYNGGATPAGVNATDAANPQAIYAPHKRAGGFCGGFGSHMADGGIPSGMPTGPEMGSWITRREATDSVHNGGLFNSLVPGRTDQLNTNVPGGSYVIPADVVSGLGEGNTMAGAAVLDKMFNTMPFGTRPPRMHGGRGIPHAPAPFHTPPLPRAAGGPTSDHVPIVAAGGEYLVHPDAVKRLGNGDLKKGHGVLDRFVVHARKQTAKEMNKLPGPKK